MQHDDVIWSIIDQNFCSFKAKVSKTDKFCRNPYNVSGLCSKATCPLANSRYATIREEEGICYLYMKTIERAHSPKNLWEKVKLSRNYKKSLEIIDEQLQFWPKHMIHRNKQRLTKIHQYLARMRKLSLKIKPKLVRVHKKTDKREENRETKALSAAKLERSITTELLERLKKGTYGDIYNFPQAEYDNVLDKEEENYEDEEGEEEEGEGDVEYVEDFEGSDDEEEMEDYVGEDIDSESEEEEEELPPAKRQKVESKRGTRVEVEYENEEENGGKEIDW